LLEQARLAWRSSTLLFATCDADESRGFDRVLVMEAGRIVEDGEPQALASSLGSRYATLLAAEREAARGTWSEKVFRHVRLEEGRLTGALPATERELERGAWTDTVFRHLHLRDPEDPGERP
jgi:ATP-binding cassette subfamily B protein